MIALATGLFAILGVLFMGAVRSGKREDECRACRRRRELDEYIWGTEAMTKYARLTRPHDPEWRDGKVSPRDAT